MKLIYNVKDKPKFGQVIVFALQQLLAIMAATIAVPAIINQGMGLAGQDAMSATAALFGAGVGTLVYLLFTRFKSPVFLGSSFAFLGSMFAAFAGAGSVVALGYLGLVIGAAFAGLVYVVIAIVVKFAGTKWINKIMPAVVIGPTVSIIGLGLAGNAVGDLQTSGTAYKVAQDIVENGEVVSTQLVTRQDTSVYVCIICGLVTLAVTMLCSVFGKKMLKMIPFIIGILSGYAVAAIFTVIGTATGNDALKVINFSLFSDIKWLPDFTFIKAFGGFKDVSGSFIATIAAAYIPVAFVVFAEHIADHKNLSSVIGTDLTKDPGLHRTLLGDGVGSMAGAFFGGCPNTTYGECIACVAISGNASVITVCTTAVLAILVSFIGPFATFLASIPACVMGGVCIALYGFIAVSGLKMIQKVDLGDNRNLFVVSIVLISGIGGLALTFGQITITNVACAVILGILTNLMLNGKKKAVATTETTETETAETVEVSDENK